MCVSSSSGGICSAGGPSALGFCKVLVVGCRVVRRVFVLCAVLCSRAVCFC